MRIIKTSKGMQRFSDNMRKKGKTIGFVPTMGYFHDGHLALMKAAKQECDSVVISIFVNPMQFGPKEDFKSYPRDIKRDFKMARSVGVDIVFMPKTNKMYEKDFSTIVDIPGRLTGSLCGLSRKGHFKGVTTVVAKLFNIVKPNIAYFGAKDAQQCVVIKQMVKDLNFDIKIKVIPTVREKGGLAMSSRNSYLSNEERKKAVVLYQSLKLAQKMIANDERSAAKIIKAMHKKISEVPVAKIDYISVVNSETLERIGKITGKILIALAVYVGKARLIDNITFNVI